MTAAPLSLPGFPAAAYGPVAAAAVAAARGSGRKVYGTGGSQACPSVQGKVKALWICVAASVHYSHHSPEGGDREARARPCHPGHLPAGVSHGTTNQR